MGALHFRSRTSATSFDASIGMICGLSWRSRVAAASVGPQRTWALAPRPSQDQLTGLRRRWDFKLFNRVPEGLRITDEGRAIISDVQGIDRATTAIVRRSRFRGALLRGVVRLAITEGLGNYWLLPQLIEFTASNRLLTVELSCTMEPTDVVRLQSDISVQFHKPTNCGSGRREVGRLHTHPFVSVEYERLHGLPRNIVEARKHRIIQQVSPLLPVDALRKGLGVDSLEGIVGIRTNTSSGVLYAVERSAGIGLLADLLSRLRRPLCSR